jgi:hypothetical protein
MKILKTLILLVITVYYADAQVRKYSNEFLNIGVGARALGMSGAQVASVNDVYSGYWNPAGLMQSEANFSAALMHSEYFAGIAKFDYASVVKPINDGNKRIGFSLIRFGVDDIPNTLFLKEPDGSINYDKITSFSAANYAFIASYASNTGITGLTYGGNLKVIHNNVGSFANSWGMGIDAGIQYRSKEWRLGATIKDVTTTFNAWSFNFTDQEQQVLLSSGNVIPSSSTELTAPQIILGGAYNWKISEKFNLLPELNMVLTTDGKRNVLIPAKPFSIDPKFGIEGSYANMIFLRAGVGNIQKVTSDIDAKSITTMQPNIGIGIRIKTITIDYAFTNLGYLSNALYSHVFSVKLDINKK